MLKDNSDQLEMFSDTLTGRSSARVQQKEGDPTYIKKVHAYQKTIVILIVFIFVLVVSFSIGVEKGKRLMMVKPQPPAIGAVNPAMPAEHVIEKTLSVEAAKPSVREGISDRVNPKTKDVPDIQKGSFTIQVASISKGTNIKKELDNLKNNGHNAFSLLKGKYTVICVGKFSLKEDAKGYQEKLKANYPDCLIRSL